MSQEQITKAARERVELDYRCIAGAAIAFENGRLPWQSVANDIWRYNQSKNRLAEIEGNMKNTTEHSYFDESQWKAHGEQVQRHQELVRKMKLSDLIEELWEIDRKLKDSYTSERSTLGLMRKNLKDEIDSRALPR